MVGVGPLLSFSDPALESAFLASLNERRLRWDRLYLYTLAGDNLLLVLLRLVPRSQWSLVYPLLLDGLCALALLLYWRCAGSMAYMRHRSLLMGPMLIFHAVCLTFAQPAMISGPTCEPSSAHLDGLLAALRFWAFEALHQLIPWTALSCALYLLPLKHAVPVQAATVAALLLPPCAARRRTVSLQLCPMAERHYGQAAAALRIALACVLPHPGPLWASDRLSSDSEAYFMLTAIAQLLLSFVAPLAWLAVREWRARRALAQERSPAAVLALQYWAEQWRLGPFEWVAALLMVTCAGMAGPWLATLTAH